MVELVFRTGPAGNPHSKGIWVTLFSHIDFPVAVDFCPFKQIS